ncbi:ATP-binding protein [Streptomyces sp. NPDC095613]|uniref:ATP-binding protein n=1 Tax=Streptomyces sp. NPDC095613 TaxID=3155540 RepID=UPI003327BF07
MKKSAVQTLGVAALGAAIAVTAAGTASAASSAGSRAGSALDSVTTAVPATVNGVAKQLPAPVPEAVETGTSTLGSVGSATPEMLKTLQTLQANNPLMRLLGGLPVGQLGQLTKGVGVNGANLGG